MPDNKTWHPPVLRVLHTASGDARNGDPNAESIDAGTATYADPVTS